MMPSVKRGNEQYSVSKFIAYMGKVLAGQRENIYSLYEHIHTPKAPTAMLSHPLPTVSHPPLLIKSTASHRKIRVPRAVTGHSCATSWPYPIHVCIPKITMIHAMQHAKKRPHLESGFPPSPSWEAGDCSHPPPMAHRVHENVWHSVHISLL